MQGQEPEPGERSAKSFLIFTSVDGAHRPTPQRPASPPPRRLRLVEAAVAPATTPSETAMGVPVSPEQEHEVGRPAVIAPASTDIDARLLAILRAKPDPTETIASAYHRKEHELGAVFAALAPVQALELHRRLSRPRPDDELAARFARLVPPRRARLLAFLADARRRAAMGHRSR